MSFITKSSIKTPIYASLLFNCKGFSFLILSEALIPATSPCAEASSYPDVPFICPAKNSPPIFFVSRVDSKGRL